MLLYIKGVNDYFKVIEVLVVVNSLYGIVLGKNVFREIVKFIFLYNLIGYLFGCVMINGDKKC